MNEELTLRDLFAGLVAAGLASSSDFNPAGSISRRILAEQAFAVADELMEARSVQDDAGQRLIE